jgi:hypothetical protein
MPTGAERELLDFFNWQHRPVPFEFGNYFPTNFEPRYSLSQYLSPEFKEFTVGNLLDRVDM